MKYISTRGKSAPCSAAAAIIRGLAPDGGLYVPESVPFFTEDEVRLLPIMDYRQTACLVLGKFLDFSQEDICLAVEEAYASFDTPEPVVLHPLTQDLQVLELWHGPTSAFKDMALQLLPRLLTLSLKYEDQQQITHILTATSGDTGKAALEGFKNVPGTRITVFYPEDGVSQIQKAQMVTQQGDNVNVVAVKGNFDDAQTAVKKIFSDPALAAQLEKDHVRLSSANSINWGRLLPQIVYYVYSAFRANRLSSIETAADEPVNFVVPTGNFGDILAGFYAKMMGAPVGLLVCASNANDVLTDFFRTGTYDRRREFHQTISPSMDILISSNLERLLYLAAGPDKTALWMETLSKEGYYTVDDDTLEKLTGAFSAYFCDDEETSAVIRFCFDQYRYLMDPHTAVGMSAFFQGKSDIVPCLFGNTVLISTASPFKFAVNVLEALGEDNSQESTDPFSKLDLLSSLSGLTVPSGLADLKDLSVRFTKVMDPSELSSVVK